MAGEVTIQLKYPVKSGEETYTEITLRRPKGKDLRVLPSDPGMKETLDLIMRLANVTKHVVDEMDAEDIDQASDVITGFQKRGPKTGDEFTPS